MKLSIVIMPYIQDLKGFVFIITKRSTYGGQEGVVVRYKSCKLIVRKLVQLLFKIIKVPWN